MLYNILLVSAIYQYESALDKHMSPPSWASLPPPTPSHLLGCHRAPDWSFLSHTGKPLLSQFVPSSPSPHRISMLSFVIQNFEKKSSEIFQLFIYGLNLFCLLKCTFTPQHTEILIFPPKELKFCFRHQSLIPLESSLVHNEMWSSHSNFPPMINYFPQNHFSHMRNVHSSADLYW